MTTNEICKTCGLAHPHPDTGFMPKHPFNDGSLAPSQTFGKRGSDGVRRGSPSPQRGSGPAESAPQPRWPFDPVLRQTLIDAGLITPQMLIDAEAKIRAITASFENGVADGQREGR